MKDSLDRLIELALDEDLGAAGDVTSNALVPPDALGSGELLAKEQLVLAGLDAFARVFHYVDPEVTVEFLRKDGDRLVLHWVMSTWNPYVVVHMRSELEID